MRCLAALLVLLIFGTGQIAAQSRTVLPHELELWVEVDAQDDLPFTREMVLITIRGVYRRHITLEELIQPDLEGFSWTQLGDDLWKEERINGEKVKTFRRRMALYPDNAGTLEIGAFRHKLTLTDEGDDWFEHQIASEPTQIDVLPAPESQEWWFPAKAVRVSDQWSNAPDQLKPGEGVLRVVRIEALGVTPEMIPPMPELKSPTGNIFPHPERRLIELTPEGPQSFAYWRWTIRPGNDTSTIVEPITFSYFDTFARVDREVTITAQRVAYGSVTPDQNRDESVGRPLAIAASAQLPGWPLALVSALVLLGGTGLALHGYRIDLGAVYHRLPILDPLARDLRSAARLGKGGDLRRAAAALQRRDGATQGQRAALTRLDQVLFAPQGRDDENTKTDRQTLHALARDLLRH